ncbi:hypothetical protein AVEN_76020-1 [Araneus ventricosus]|uniref:Uncharacterized protein n=1 Tax=Araneus ventricosus TaxID=182803 RepID=A0A4Y2VBK5_ARAVE|nr:hypothetical protein AVEN_37617-1 [Araneus ventricosus]GBO22665.1 hypothetical protein AVEN_76020-1 [Araneus ventricosus]
MRRLWRRWRFSNTYLRPSSRHHIAAEHVVHAIWYGKTFFHRHVFPPPYYHQYSGSYIASAGTVSWDGTLEYRFMKRLWRHWRISNTDLCPWRRHHSSTEHVVPA